eukprot:CAMPEP_0177170814 /NCGR_PEP_ID=MMETSP0367-20130122/10295_1 /TAXON_ID=447022 ORGANISM="Scrippsiella hangoei-like, Strain SHHI-4" /NCGR_SAMPLE_ID=MMETSP0367 /ASSEMBLY_ACC=CAM_ASM_000362 /LENGTH=588 /DNA_ID=CAMNT_0018617029 /DNA_START=1 /DNA_END=1764 /DNA_ORIENTATION=+
MGEAVEALAQSRAGPLRCASCGCSGAGVAATVERPELFEADGDGVFCKACYVERCWVPPPPAAKLPRGPGRPRSKEELLGDTDAAHRGLAAARRALEEGGGGGGSGTTAGLVGAFAELSALLAKHQQRAQHLALENASLADQRMDLERALAEQAAHLSELFRADPSFGQGALQPARDLAGDALDRQLRLKRAEIGRLKDDVAQLERQLQVKQRQAQDLRRQAEPLRAEKGRLDDERSRPRLEQSHGGVEDEARAARRERLAAERNKTFALDEDIVRLRLELRRERQQMVGLNGEFGASRLQAKREAAAQHREAEGRLGETFEAAHTKAGDRRSEELDERLEALEDAEANLDDAEFIADENRMKAEEFKAEAAKLCQEVNEAAACRAQLSYRHERDAEKRQKELNERRRLMGQLTSELPGLRTRIRTEHGELAALKGAAEAAEQGLEAEVTAAEIRAEAKEAEDTMFFDRGRKSLNLKMAMQQERVDSAAALAALRADLEAVRRLRLQGAEALATSPWPPSEATSVSSQTAAAPPTSTSEGPQPGLLPLPPRLLLTGPDDGRPAPVVVFQPGRPALARSTLAGRTAAAA